MQPAMKTCLFCSLTILLLGCGPTPQQPTPQEQALPAGRHGALQQRQNARKEFRDAVSAMLICTRGSNRDEFHKARISLETCYESNRHYLADCQRSFQDLSTIMTPCDTLFFHAVRYGDEFPVRPWGEQKWWQAMLLLNPALASKTNLTYQQMERDRDFSSPRAVRKALTLISFKCDRLLADLIAIEN